MDTIVRCPICNKGYRFKDKSTGTDRLYLSNKINLNPKINCKCGNVYGWSKTEHKFEWVNLINA